MLKQVLPKWLEEQQKADTTNQEHQKEELRKVGKEYPTIRSVESRTGFG